MGYSYQRYLIARDDTILRMANTAFDRMLQDPTTCRLSELAGQRVRTTEVMVGFVGRELAASFTSQLRWPTFRSIRRLMNTSSPDFVTVDMRGLKAALVARAHQERVSVSILVRAAVAHNLGLMEPGTASWVDAPVSPVSRATTVKLSIHLTPAEAARFAAGARAAALSHGAYLAGLLADVPVLSAGANRSDHLTALIASSSELLTLSRNLHHLSTLLRQGHVQAAQEYREMLDTLAGDVRNHLTLASGVLVDLQPRRQRAEPLKHPTT